MIAQLGDEDVEANSQILEIRDPESGDMGGQSPGNEIEKIGLQKEQLR